MSVHLVVIAGPDKGKKFKLADGETLVIGRSKTTDTHLSDPHVSRVHCEIEVQKGKVLVRDAKSAGGTFVNGDRIVEKVLKPKEIVQIGETQMRVEGMPITEHDTELVNVEGGLKDVTPPVRAVAVRGAPPPSVRELADLIGETIAHYTLKHVIAAGNTGLVFYAEDQKSGDKVALKILKYSFSQDDKQVQRFIRAMKTMKGIRHPNLIALYNAGKAKGFCWIAMEYIEGESLTDVIRKIGYGGRLDWPYAFRVAVHVARALEFAHDKGILHRNITPQNIMILSSDKTAKLGDLMLAKAIEGSLALHITRPGELVGDIFYMAPERTHGTLQLDARTDIYSIGATVYALLTGKPPFEGESFADTVAKIRRGEPERPKKHQLAIPQHFEGIVLKMLAKRPENRQQSATELLADLERAGKAAGIKVE